MLDAAERLTSFTGAAEQCGNGKSQWEPETSGPLNPWRVSPMSGAPRSRPWKLHQSREPQTEHRVRSVETSSRTDLKNLQMPTIGWRFLDTAWLASGFSIYLVAKPETVKFPCSQGSTEGLHGQPRPNIWALAAVGFFCRRFQLAAKTRETNLGSQLDVAPK